MLSATRVSVRQAAQPKERELAPPPKVKITLLSRKLVMNVAATSVFLGAFTAAAYKGVVAQKFTVHTDDKAQYAMIDDRVELYNTVSGFLIALIETGLGVYMNNFLPAFLVYLHNSLWCLHSNATATKWTNALRSTLMFIYPVFLMLVIGQSLRSFQAAQSSVGFERIMSVEDLSPSVSATELLKLNASLAVEESSTHAGGIGQLRLGILSGAINGTSVPFDLKLNSSCDMQRSGLKISLADLDTVTVAYGFPTNEWYSEMLDIELEPWMLEKYNQSYVDDGGAYEIPDLDMDLAAEMFANSKVLLDRAIAESILEYDECEVTGISSLDTLLDAAVESEGDDESLADVRCNGALSTLVEVGKFLKLDPSVKTPDRLLDLISMSLGIAIEGLNTSSTKLELRKHNVTSQIQMESMIISAESVIDSSSEDFFNGEDNLYDFGTYTASLCGSDNCVFVDPNNKFQIPHQVVLLPYQTGCSYAGKNITYRNDLRSFVPSGCAPVANATMAVAISSYIVADRYGPNITAKFPTRTSGAPFLDNPRRVVRLTMSKLTWQTAALDQTFDAGCVTSSRDCTGLAYKLTKTGRYVFASENALPVDAIQRATLMTPIQLVQFNRARLYVKKWGQFIPERLRWQSGVFKYSYWANKTLSGANCSRFIDSYLDHVEANGYFIDRPFQLLARATMFYLFSGGSVTELNHTTLALNAHHAHVRDERDARAAGADERQAQRRQAAAQGPHRRAPQHVQGHALRVRVAAADRRRHCGLPRAVDRVLCARDDDS